MSVAIRYTVYEINNSAITPRSQIFLSDQSWVRPYDGNDTTGTLYSIIFTKASGVPKNYSVRETNATIATAMG